MDMLRFFKKRWRAWFFCSLLWLVSPWFVQLWQQGVSPFWQEGLVNSPRQFLTNLGNHLWPDYLFFYGDTGWSHGEIGLLYLFQLPLILYALYRIFLRPQNSPLWVAVAAGLGLITVSLFRAPPSLSVSLLYLPFLQYLSFWGWQQFWREANKVSNVVAVHPLPRYTRASMARRRLRFLFFFFTLWMLYEVSFFFHILKVHFPKI